jgi:1-acyl-sn-glycerol-3-phosphate acyltransferase
MQDTGYKMQGTLDYAQNNVRERVMRAVHWISVRVVRLAAKVLLRVQATGLERMPSSGPAILVVNHVNFIEPLLLYVLLPRQVTALAKAELWDNPISRLVFQSWGSIPIRRGEMDLNAILRALQVVQQGGVLGLAPEGTRSHHGRLQRGRAGVVLLALRAPNTLILPAAVYGQEQFYHNLRRLRRTAVQVVMGEGFYLQVGQGRVTHEMRQAISDEIMMRIAALLPEQYRGVYGDMPSITPRYLRSEPGS